MKKKIFFSTILMASISLLSGMALIMGILYNYFSELMTNELSDEAHYIATGIESNGLSYLENLPISSSKRITLIDSDGTVIFDSEADIGAMDNHSDREEFLDALHNGQGSSSRYSSTLSTKTIYYALKLSDGTVLRTAYTQYTIWSLIFKNMLPQMLAIFAVVIFVSSLLSSALSKRLLQPIDKIDLNHPDIREGYDELIPLIKKINSQNEMIRAQIEEMKRNQKNFKAITENMSEGLLVTDKSGTLLSYNSAALKLLGANAPSDTVSIFTLNRSEAFRTAVEEALSDHHSFQKLHIDNAHYQIIANPVHEKGIVTGSVIIIMDISEKEQLEQMRREFTSNVSHELKTPLTSISGMSELLMTGVVPKEDTMDFGKSIYEESARLVSLVNDIIKLSQLDEGIVPAPKEMVDLHALSAEILARLQTTADKRNITFELSGEAALVEGVPLILDEMISNLCDNAIKYNKDGGKVMVNVKSNEQFTTITVSDTGIGIPKEHLGRVFERFYRVDKSHSKQIGGTGLGLSIFKHAAMFHGATYTIESTIGVGTQISINFKKIP